MSDMHPIFEEILAPYTELCDYLDTTGLNTRDPVNCDWCGEPITKDQLTVSAPDGPVHYPECSAKAEEHLRDWELETEGYRHIHES